MFGLVICWGLACRRCVFMQNDTCISASLTVVDWLGPTMSSELCIQRVRLGVVEDGTDIHSSEGSS